MKIYETLVEIVNSNPDLLKEYRTDLTTHDKAFVAGLQPFESFVWVLREMGTNVFPLDKSLDSGWLTYHCDDTKTKFYLVSHAGEGQGMVTEISKELARELATEYCRATPVDSKHATNG